MISDCWWDSGRIWVTLPEISRISRFLKITEIDFIQKYLLLENHTEDGFECVFFDTKIMGCLVYPVRSLQCSSYLLWEKYRTDWEEFIKGCPGIS